MSDFYTEQLIKKQPNMKDTLKKLGLIILAIVSVLVVFVFPIGIIFSIIIIVLVCFLFTRLDIEYEYLYVNGDLDIDKIMHKSKRKRVFSANVKEMELLAPAGDHHLDQYRNTKVIDLSSSSESANLYAMIVPQNGVMTKLIFEPNETIIEGMFLMAPRKVVRK
ncbi:MAG: DUF6106 family protein [Lachnospiraceae bacterium]